MLPDVYAKYLTFGNKPIDQPNSEWDIPKKATKHIEELMEAYGHLSTFDMELLSREEEPWKAAQAKDGNKTISHKLMQNFYKLRLNVEK